MYVERPYVDKALDMACSQLFLSVLISHDEVKQHH